jgi:hypothetical protein
LNKANSIFMNAKVYSRASRLLNERGVSEPSLLIPSMVNAALSLELYFKALYWLENNKDFKIDEKHSHDFSKIFDSLSDTLRNNIENNFRALLKNRDMKDVIIMEQMGRIVIPKTLKDNLDSWSQVFTKLRYVYEPKGQQISMMFFPELEESIMIALRTLYPRFI